MSGSDDGRIFVWEKLTGKLVNLMMGDRVSDKWFIMHDTVLFFASFCHYCFYYYSHSFLPFFLFPQQRVVNCIQPHPFYPILATSGIDYDVKLWYPTADSPYNVSEAEEIVKKNREQSRESASPFFGERVTVPVPANMFFHFLCKCYTPKRSLNTSAKSISQYSAIL